MKHPGGQASNAASEASQSLASKRSAVLTKATIRAAGELGLGQSELAKVLGISASTASRMSKGEWSIPETSKSWELAALLVRAFRSLDAMVGGNRSHAQQWFRAENTHLGGTPVTLVFRIEGLTNVARYLDAMRGAQ